MKQFLIAWLCVLLIATGFTQAQTQTRRIGDYIENISNASANRQVNRPLQYRPDGEDFISINGKNRFTRALYGSHTLFRIETSDRPVFATYSKNNNKHIAFKIKIGDRVLALDSTDYCKSIYKPGRRDYELNDPLFNNRQLSVSSQAFYDKEGGIWKINFDRTPDNATLICLISEIKNPRLQRSGDMGVDPIDAFEMPANPSQLKVFEVDLNKLPSAREAVYVVYENFELFQVDSKHGEQLYKEAEAHRLKLANTLKIKTPDPYLNTLGATIAMAADGCWDGEVWVHGAIGWRMPLNGWRAAYVGDALGWHDRARTHFDNYAASQVTEVPPIYSHPQQDTALNLTRALKKWGTPMYSNGYIARNPRNNKQMHHYDMNLVYIDELLWHLKWTGDLDYAKKIFPVIKLHLAWEKRNFDPDGDGLYDAYAATWASDALMYNSGGTTIGSSYNYRSNKIAAEIATLIGEDPTPYQQEAAKILKAVNQKLWLSNKGWWAEYVDFMGGKMTHEHAAVWSVYTPVDAGIGDMFQTYQATRYVDNHIPHIDVKTDDVDGEYQVVSTTSWMPYAWSLNNVAFAEVGHTALAYWIAGRPDEATRLFKSNILDGMYLGNSPANIGQTSFYDAARGECYRDFSDPVGVYSRAVVQGLFGIQPDALHDKLIVRPGFPSDWDFAEINHPNIDFRFDRKASKDSYTIQNKFSKKLKLYLQIPAIRDQIKSVKVNGKKIKWQVKEHIERPLIEIPCEYAENYRIEIVWSGQALDPSNGRIAEVLEIYNPQQLNLITNKVTGTYFEKIKQGQMTWWRPIHVKSAATPAKPKLSENSLFNFNRDKERNFRTVNMDATLNAKVTDIFNNEYLSPRSPYTTLQTPKQGVGEWCHPKLTYKIDDSGFRAALVDQTFLTPFGIPFRSLEDKNNIAFTTLWDNYPDSLSVAVQGKANHAYFLMAGTTGAMQYGVPNGKITVRYSDGSSSEMVLENPENWYAIEMDYFIDGMAFNTNSPRPYRVSLKTGQVSNDMGTVMHIPPTEVYYREIEGGAAILLDMPLDAGKELQSIQWKTIANEVIVGMMGITLSN